jgi:hypothetical protein
MAGFLVLAKIYHISTTGNHAHRLRRTIYGLSRFDVPGEPGRSSGCLRSASGDWPHSTEIFFGAGLAGGLRIPTREAVEGVFCRL